MTFEEWIEDQIFYWNELGREDLEIAFNAGYEAGWRQGHKEGYVYRETVAMSTEGGV